MNRTFDQNGNAYSQVPGQPAMRTALFKFEDSQPTLTDGLGNKFWFADTTAAPVAIAFPPASDGVGPLRTVKRLTAGANALTISADSGNIEGSATYSIPTQYTSVTFISDGTNYWIV